MFGAIEAAVSTSSLLVFYVVLCLGAGLWFVIAMVFGEASDVIGDALGDVDVDGDTDGGNVLSIRNILLFCMGFGGAGAIAVSLGAGLWVSVISGTAGGLLIAGVGVMFFRVLRRQEATTSYNSDLLVGSTGTVTLEVRPGGTGEISARDNRGASVRLAATPARGVEDTLLNGTVVSITAMHGGTAVVKPLDD